MTRVTTQSPRQQAGLQKLPPLSMRALSILYSTLPRRSCCFLGSSIYNSGDEPPRGRKGGSDMVECGCVILHTTGGVSVRLCGAHSYGIDMLPVLRQFLH